MRSAKVTRSAGIWLDPIYDFIGKKLSAADALGYLLSLRDARLSTTQFTYDDMNRRKTKKDPLLATETSTWDKNGNMLTSLDRKGQLTQVTYDALNRPVTVTYADLSSITITYDAGNRATQIVDSVNGTITRSFDAFNRVLTETTAQGTLTYTYDAIGRRQTMQVSGQPVVTYTWDDANRLTGIGQGSATVVFSYDGASRRTSMTLPNGVVVSYGYDAASRLASMSYAKGGGALGDLSYSYDAAGRRIAMGGSLARVNLPVAVASMGYDAANRMTSRGLNTLTYDANGNLTGDGTNSYTWNARDQLSGMTGASFAYDAGGRRRSKTVGGTGTSFLYDGANAVQETGGAGPANVLGGLGMDEMFQRTDAGGTRSFQTDGLGSVLGLMDGAGTVMTAYTYEAFGGATASGAAAANSAGFTGRENDGTGLMFYRARYYSPALGRFISEDPLGFGGGDVNLYAYVGNGPTNAVDPTGEFGFFAGMLGYAALGGLLQAAAALTWEARHAACDPNYKINKAVILNAAAIGIASGALSSLSIFGSLGGVIALSIGSNLLQVVTSAPFKDSMSTNQVLEAALLATYTELVGALISGPFVAFAGLPIDKLIRELVESIVSAGASSTDFDTLKCSCGPR